MKHKIFLSIPETNWIWFYFKVISFELIDLDASSKQKDVAHIEV